MAATHVIDQDPGKPGPVTGTITSTSSGAYNMELGFKPSRIIIQDISDAASSNYKEWEWIAGWTFTKNILVAATTPSVITSVSSISHYEGDGESGESQGVTLSAGIVSGALTLTFIAWP